MDIDKARGDIVTTGINDPLSLQRPGMSDLGDLAILYGDVAIKPGVPAPVQDPTVGKYKVECHMTPRSNRTFIPCWLWSAR
jgi:hypothetical protein